MSTHRPTESSSPLPTTCCSSSRPSACITHASPISQASGREGWSSRHRSALLPCSRWVKSWDGKATCPNTSIRCRSLLSTRPSPWSSRSMDARRSSTCCAATITATSMSTPMATSPTSSCHCDRDVLSRHGSATCCSITSTSSCRSSMDTMCDIAMTCSLSGLTMRMPGRCWTESWAKCSCGSIPTRSSR